MSEPVTAPHTAPESDLNSTHVPLVRTKDKRNVEHHPVVIYLLSVNRQKLFNMWVLSRLQVPTGPGRRPAAGGGSLPRSRDRRRPVRSLFRRHDGRHQEEDRSDRGR